MGNDRLDVSNPTGNNTVYGDDGDDILIGGLASDQLFGGAGDDLLLGGIKGSKLTGGTGADRFYLGNAAVPEVPIEVLDFTKGQQDKVLILGISEIKDFSNLILEQTGADTTVKANIGGSVKALGILKNIQANTLTANDFSFTGIINNNDDVPLSKNPNNDIFTLKGDARLKVTLTGQTYNRVNELGVFTVDDSSGNVGSDRAAYVKENLKNAKIIFSTIANLPNGFDPLNPPLTRVLEFDGDVKNLRFYLVRNSTTESVLQGQTATTEVLFADASVQKFTELGADGYSLEWEDGSGNSTDFKDLVVKLQSTNNPLSLGTKLQGNADGSEVIDLRDQTTDVTAKFSVYREAAFNNLVGFYQVDDATGRIGTLNPGDAGYAQAAISKRVADIDLRVNNQQIATFENKKFSPGAIFAPFIITNGVTVDQVLNGQVNQVYFAYLGANSDKVDHVRLLGNNIFGFEDISGGGDRDFNDVIIKVDLKV